MKCEIGDTNDAYEMIKNTQARLLNKIYQSIIKQQKGLKMTIKEIKQEIENNNIDKRDLAYELNITPSYLTSMLNGWAPMKIEYQKSIERIIKETIQS